jgi:AraC-like DNA-binding protein
MARPSTFPVDAAWRPLLKDLGVHPANVLRRAGLPEDLFSRPEAGLGTPEYFRFWSSLQAEVGDPLFPLRLVEAISAEAFVPPLFAALCSPDLGTAVRRISHYKRLVAPMALDVGTPRGALLLELRWLHADSAAVPPSLVTAELAFFVRLARLATREPVQAHAVAMPSVPQPAAAYERYFGAPVRKGSVAAVTFSAADAARPFLTANDAVWKIFEPDLRRRLSELDESAGIAERVRAVLLEALPGGQASIDQVAGRLAMSRRTLQRRLGDEGTTYNAIVSRTREDLARHYLTRTRLPCSEISFLLGFDDPNSFFRAFHDWTGQTPEGLRESAAD